MSNRKCRRLQGGCSAIQATKTALAERTVTYSDLHTSLHAPWVEYMQRLFPASLSPHERERRLAACWWVGAEAKVTVCKHAAHVGEAGVLLWSSADLLHIVTPSDRIVSVHRRGCRVDLTLPAWLHERFGAIHSLVGSECP